MAAVGKAQAIQPGGRRCGALGALQGCDQGIDFATGFKATQGANVALAGFAFLVTEGLDQLGVATISGLGDFDEHGAECSAHRLP